MAKVVAPALSLRASGNLGDINYFEWRGKAIARIKNPAVQPNNPLQQSKQAHLEDAAAAWSGSLTPLEREAWDGIARNVQWSDRMGIKWVPSGYNLFMKLNIQALNLGGVISLYPPMPFPSTLPERADLTYNGSVPQVEVRLDNYPAGLEPDLIQVFRAGPYDGGGRHAILPEYRQLGTAATPFKYSDATIIATKWFWYRFRWAFLVGVVGNWFELQIHCV